MSSLINQLEKLHLFKDVPQKELEHLVKLCHVQRFQPGQVIFAQGSEANCAMILVSGRLEVSIQTGLINRHIGEIHPGEIFGEQGLLHSSGTRNAQVSAKRESICLVLVSQMMRDTWNNQAIVALEQYLIATMARRIRNTNLAIQKVWKEEQLKEERKFEQKQEETPQEESAGLLGKLRSIFGGK
mgnify:CR=1 FL=1